ncbi:Protein tyrosine phosphatase type IVA 1 [Allomyces arbusculus]|nr:Protein tyrosine phosphatase type IVA 1 [Allomyces arbusculus]
MYAPSPSPLASSAASIAGSDRISPVSYLSRMFSVVAHAPLRFLILDCPTDSTLPAAMKIFDKEHVTDVVRVCEPTYSTDLLVAAGIHVHDLPFKDGGVPPPAIVHRFLDLVEARFGPIGSTGSGAGAVDTTPTRRARRSGSPVTNSNAAAAAAASNATLAAPMPTLMTSASNSSLAAAINAPALPARPLSRSRSRPPSLDSAVSTGSAPAAMQSSTPVPAAVPRDMDLSGPPPTMAVHCVAGLGRAPVLIAVALIEYGMPPLEAIEYVRARRRGAFNTMQVRYLDAYKPTRAKAAGRASAARGAARALWRLGGGGGHHSSAAKEPMPPSRGTSLAGSPDASPDGSPTLEPVAHVSAGEKSSAGGWKQAMAKWVSGLRRPRAPGSGGAAGSRAGPPPVQA